MIVWWLMVNRWQMVLMGELYWFHLPCSSNWPAGKPFFTFPPRPIIRDQLGCEKHDSQEPCKHMIPCYGPPVLLINHCFPMHFKPSAEPLETFNQQQSILNWITVGYFTMAVGETWTHCFLAYCWLLLVASPIILSLNDQWWPSLTHFMPIHG